MAMGGGGRRGRSCGWLAGVAIALGAAGGARAGTATVRPFGAMPDGSAVTAVRLANAHGLVVTVMTLGASIQAALVPDAHGRVDDVVLGYDGIAGYLAQPNYFGATVGRVANRIARGRFTLDGRAYQVPVNNGANALHGGTVGFDKRNWTLVASGGGAHPFATFRLVSADGDQGFPGTLTATATYALDDDGSLHVDYGATTDRPTIVNLSNHSYWNLAGEGAAGGALAARLTIPADTFLPTDAGAIPTGEFRAVAGTPFDFRTPAAIVGRVRDGRDEQLRLGRGYDHNWVVSRTPPKGMQLMARVEDPASGRVMEVLSDQPGVQFYSGNFLDATIAGKQGHLYREGDAVALEPQAFPDTPNRPAFGSVRLDPGRAYASRIVYRFSAR